MELVFNEFELKKYCEGFCKEIWDERFEIPIEISGRLTSSFGLFYYSKRTETSKKIVIAKRLLVKGSYKMETILSVIKHELCHYHLYRNGLESDDHTPTFDAECVKVKASLTETISTSGTVISGYCKCCGKRIIKDAKPRHYNNPNRYFSRCCKSKLRYETSTYNDESVNEFIDYDNRFLGVIEGYQKCANKINHEEVKVQRESTSLKIENIVVPGKRGVTRTQVHPAVEHCVDERSPEKLKMIKEHYPEYFRQVCMYISKKRLKYIKEVGLA